MTEAYARFGVRLDVVIRPCTRADLPALEWMGMFSAQRQRFHSLFAEHQRDELVMLVVEANRIAAGQAWIDLERRRASATAVIWAVRILPVLQRLGIGQRLLLCCEEVARARGCRQVELTVEQDNPGARRLYERLGYQLVGTLRAGGDQWLMRKELVPHDERVHP